MAESAEKAQAWTSEELLSLADEYRAAASRLLDQGRKGHLASRAPARLCAVHATELYLNAFLLARGVAPNLLRRNGHDFADKAAIAATHGLTLRRKTLEHLGRLTERREYLALRYGPSSLAAPSPDNRILATLDEIARKVHAVGVGARAAPAATVNAPAPAPSPVPA